jgi:integrase
LKFTQSNVRKITPPADKADHWVPDDGLDGFGLRFRNGGEGIYGIRYGFGGRDRRLAYNKVSRVTLADAQAWAKAQFASIAQKVDPGVERMRAATRSATSIEPLIDNYLAYLADNDRSEKYIFETDRSLKRYLRALLKYGPNDVSRTMVAAELQKIKTERGSSTADHVRSHLSSFYGWCLGEGLAEANPVLGVNRTNGKPRERLLSDLEVEAIWQALGDDDYSQILKLLLVTGARREEIAALSWKEVNLQLKQIELPGSRVKNRRDFIIPLAPLPLKILKGRKRRPGTDYIFGRGDLGYSGWGRAKLALDSKLQIAPWVLHDFRRYISTTLHERLNIEPHIVEAILNHVSGARGRIAGVYNRAAYAYQKRDALNRYAAYVAKLVGVDND